MFILRGPWDGMAPSGAQWLQRQEKEGRRGPNPQLMLHTRVRRGRSWHSGQRSSSLSGLFCEL